MKTSIVVVGLIKKGEQVLLGQKAPGKGPYPDTWHIAGGKIELGKENTEEAMKRELKEETNFNVKNLKKVIWDTDVEPDKHGEETYYIFLQYVCDYESGELKAGDDMAHFEWVEKKDLSKYNLNKPSKKMLKHLGYL